MLTLRVALAPDARIVAEQAVAAVAAQSSLLSIATGKQGAALDLVYRVRLRPELTPTQAAADLLAIKGVDGVDLRRSD